MTGLLRVKNESRWIERSLRSILPLCEQVLVMDDHSTDNTRQICASLPNVSVFCSPFNDLNEMRDKNWLLDRIRVTEWILFIDGDEMLAPGSEAIVRNAMNSAAECLSFRVLYLWDTEGQARVDGVYGKFRRPSMFRPGAHRFQGTSAGGNFHCGNAPLALQQKAKESEGTLLHFGYLHKDDRIRKYNWYRQIDAANANEDGYRHIVIGDVFPADSKFRHGGPLRLENV